MRLRFRAFDAVKLMTSGASPIAQMSGAVFSATPARGIHSHQKSLNRFGAGAGQTAVLVIERWPVPISFISCVWGVMPLLLRGISLVSHRMPRIPLRVSAGPGFQYPKFA
jgi:hypothetical protein